MAEEKNPLDTRKALAARNEIVRQMGECRVPLITLLAAIAAANRIQDKPE